MSSETLPPSLRGFLYVVPLYQALTAVWGRQPTAPLVVPSQPPLWAYRLHLYNFRLWHTEDAVRQPGAPAAFIATCKHRIDACNQQRHQQIEQLDAWCYAVLYGPERAVPDAAELHSETPANLLDRLSILTLKVYYMGREAIRQDATAVHRHTCGQRLAVLCEQRADLAECLTRLCRDLWWQRKRFKLYLQFKMYNDPDLNPAIYRHR